MQNNQYTKYIFSIVTILITAFLLTTGCSSHPDTPASVRDSSSTASDETTWTPADDKAQEQTSDTFPSSADEPDRASAEKQELSRDSSQNSAQELSRDSSQNSAQELSQEPAPAPVVIILDPGHGGIFSGAGYDGRVEKDMTLKVAKYAKQYLEANYPNFTVYLTREEDSVFSTDIVEDLELRAEFAKEKKADALISLHFNASDSHDANGATIYISRRDNVNRESDLLAESILQKLLELGLERKGVLTRKSNDMFDENGEAYDYYAINRHCANRDMIGIIVEHCFMDSSSDICFLDSEEKLQKLGEADAKGIAEYFN